MKYQAVNAYGEVVESDLVFSEALILAHNKNVVVSISMANKPFITMEQTH